MFVDTKLVTGVKEASRGRSPCSYSQLVPRVLSAADGFSVVWKLCLKHGDCIFEVWRRERVVKCDLCGRDSSSLNKVNHKRLGRIKICPDCWKKGQRDLIHTGGCSCC